MRQGKVGPTVYTICDCGATVPQGEGHDCPKRRSPRVTPATPTPARSEAAGGEDLFVPSEAEGDVAQLHAMLTDMIGHAQNERPLYLRHDEAHEWRDARRAFARIVAERSSLRQQIAAAQREASHYANVADCERRKAESAAERYTAYIRENAQLRVDLAAAREDAERWRERLRAVLGSCIEVHADGRKKWVYGAGTITDDDLADAVREIDAARAEAGRETEGGR